MLRKATPYQPRRGLTYAIEVILTASNDDETCRCKFCIYEGHDKVKVIVVGRKCKQRSNI